MKVKKTIVKKYAEGVSSTSTPAPKKMNFVKKFINKQREKEAANHAGLEAEEQAEIAASTPKYNITQEKSFVGPQLTGLDKAVNEGTSDNAKLDAVAKTTPATKTNLTKGADAKLAAWQSKRGLVADGIWGAKSEEAYKKEQAAKPKKMAIKKTSTPEVTKTEVVTKPAHTPAMATGRKGSDGNIYFSNGRTYNPKTGEKGTVGDGSVYSDKAPNTRAANADMKAWGDATNKNKSTSNGFKSGAVKGETEAERVQRLMDTSSRVESMGGNYNPEQVKIAQEIQKGEKKDDEKTLSTLSKVGIGGAALTGAALLIGARKKGKGSSKTSTKPTQKLLGEGTRIVPKRTSTQSNIPASGAARQKRFEGAAPSTANNYHTPRTRKQNQSPTSNDGYAGMKFTAAGTPQSVNGGSMKPIGEYGKHNVKSQTAGKKATNPMPVNEAGKKAAEENKPVSRKKSDKSKETRQASTEETSKAVSSKDLFKKK